MKKLNTMLLIFFAIFVVACGNNDAQYVTLDTETDATLTEGENADNDEVATDDAETETEREINPDYAGFGVEKLVKEADGGKSTVTLEYQDDKVLMQTVENTANFENLTTTYEEATEESATVMGEYNSLVGVNYEQEMIEAGINEKITIDYRTGGDISSYNLSSLIFDSVPMLSKDTAVLDAVDLLEAEGYTLN